MFTNIWTKKSVLLLCFLFLIFSKSISQDTPVDCKFQRYFQVGAHAGTSVFFGDVKYHQYWPASYNNISEWKIGGGLNLSYQFTPAVGLRLDGMYGRLTGIRESWNMYFNSDYWETSLNTTLNLNNIFGKARDDRFLNVFGIIGLGLSQYNTELKTLYEGVVIRKVGYGYGSGIRGRTLQGIVLYGLGIDLRVADRWNIQLESMNRIMDSDMLDGVKSGYALDNYNYTSIGVTYKFGYRNKSTDFDKKVEMEEADDSSEMAESQEPIPVIIADDGTEESIIEQVYTDLDYRVQILAKYEGPLSIKFISQKYLIPMYEIREETYKGYLIYTVGSFKTYEEARRKRDELRRLFGITDAFVVAFHEDSRLDMLPEVK